MKKAIITYCLLAVLLFSLAGCDRQTGSSQSNNTVSTTSRAPSSYEPVKIKDEVRAVWITFNELKMIDAGGKEAFAHKVGEMFNRIKDLKMNTVMVHVRPFGDAFYPSAYFPFSYYLTGEQGKDPGYDPLEVMINEAHSRGMSIQAWINPYRVSGGGSEMQLSEDNPAKKWMENPETKSWVIQLPNGVYYNPAVEEVQKLIIEGVKEIVGKYEVDGIHFDDYFYPSEDAGIDAAEYGAYQSEGGKLSLADWRRANVTALISGVYSAVKSINKRVVFGVSPAGNIETTMEASYADVKLWCKKKGYIDYICPQIYFGFENEAMPFENCLEEWRNIVSSKYVALYVGLAAYKCGLEDQYASNDSGGENSPRYEWVRHQNILSRQVECLRSRDKVGGFALFSYSYILGDNQSNTMEQELGAVKKLL